MGASICWAAAKADTQFTIFDLSALKKQCLIYFISQPKSGVTLSPELVERLCDIENICCIKDAVPDINPTMEVRRRVGDRIVLSDPDEGRWFMLLAYFGRQVHMSSQSPFLYQVPGATGRSGSTPT